MEFKPKAKIKDGTDATPALPPERSQRPRKKMAQKLHKNYNTRRRLVAALKFLGKLCILVLATALLFSMFFFAYTSDAFAVRTIAVDGCEHLDSRAVEEVVRREFPTNILRIDLTALRSRLERETWVKRVEIRRILPSDLVISIQERTPSVILEMHGELMVADDEAVLLDRYDPKYGKLDVPVFKGLAGDDAASYRMYQEENTARVRLGLTMLAELEVGSPAFARDISEVDVSDKGNLKLLLVDDTAEIILGDRDFLKRFRRLLSNMDGYRDAKLQYGEMTSVDLRFDGQIVYQPRRGPAGTAAVTRP